MGRSGEKGSRHTDRRRHQAAHSEQRQAAEHSGRVIPLKTLLAHSLLVFLSISAIARADEPGPAALQGVSVDERLDAQLPLDLTFTDELGHKTTLGNCLLSGK